MSFRLHPSRCAVVSALAATFLTGGAQAASWCPAPSVPEAVAAVLARDIDKRAGDPPRAVAHLHTEGTLPHQGIWDASVEAKKDLPLVRELALSWRLHRDPAVLERLSRLLDAWASAYQPDFNPIDETDFDGLVDAFAIARSDLPQATRDKVSAFLRAWAGGYLDQMQRLASPAKTTWINNWQSHRVKLLTLIAAALDDDALFDGARQQFRKQVGQNLQADGASIDVAERDALHYQVYDLEPLVRAALAARIRGEDWLAFRAGNGASLAAGLDWLRPYASGEKQHQEYVHTTVKFDLARRAAGVPGFSGPWEPAGSASLYWLASALDARFAPVASALGPQPAWMAACWGSRP